MAHEDYVSHELAKALREAGFNWHCRAIWHYDGEDYNFIEDYGATFLHIENIPHWNDSKVWGARITSAPSLAQAAKWLREAKGIAINVIAHGRCDCRDGKYHWEEVYLPNCKENGLQWADWFIYGKHPLFDTYEQALSDGLSQMLNLINKKCR